MFLKIKGLKAVTGINVYTDRETLLPPTPGVFYKPEQEYGPRGFADLVRIGSPIGPMIFAKSLTGATSISVPDGIVTVNWSTAELMKYTKYNIWLSDLKRSSRAWAYHAGWSAAGGAGTSLQLELDTGLVLATVNGEWQNRLDLLEKPPVEREEWRIEHPPTPAPSEVNDTLIYSYLETVIVLDADYWYPYKLSFTVDNSIGFKDKYGNDLTKPGFSYPAMPTPPPA
jgi:hypothetical protein